MKLEEWKAKVVLTAAILTCINFALAIPIAIALAFVR